jgi:hypothetical protein
MAPVMIMSNSLKDLGIFLQGIGAGIEDFIVDFAVFYEYENPVIRGDLHRTFRFSHVHKSGC